MTRKASDAAIERVAERWNEVAQLRGEWRKSDYNDTFPNFQDTCDREQSLSDALRAHFGNDVPASLAGYVLPVVVDPIVQMVREAFAEGALQHKCHPQIVVDYRSGANDSWFEVKAALSVARAIAAQGGGL